jgi:hypothetical protein
MLCETESRLTRVLFRLSLYGWFGYSGYCIYDSYLAGPTTLMENSRIVRPVPPVLSNGESADVSFETTRLRSTRLAINRVAIPVSPSLVGDQDKSLDNQDQNVTGDGKRQKSSYTVTMKNLSDGDYELFSKVRYYNNLLDYIVPRYLYTEKMPFRIVSDR